MDLEKEETVSERQDEKTRGMEGRRNGFRENRKGRDLRQKE